MKSKKYLLVLVALMASGCSGTGNSNSASVTSDPSVSNTESVSTTSSEITSTTSEEPSSEPLPVGILNTLSDTKTINEYQVEAFGKSGLPSIGDVNMLVVPVEVNGTPFETGYDEKLDLVFNGSSEETGWESVSSFYNKSSYGKLNLHFDIAPKYTTVGNYSYYDSILNGYEDMIAEALDSLDETIDFSQYDNNDDGYIDSIAFIYSVQYAHREDNNIWWAFVYHSNFFTPAYPTIDGVEFGHYMWASYAFMKDSLGIPTTVNAETYIHEFGHLLGMPDLYSSSYNVGPVGGWDMMDYNCADHGPFNKLMWGWNRPLVAQKGYQYDVTLDSYSLDTDGENSVLLIPRGSANLDDGDAFDEYLLVMYYTPDGLYQGHRVSNPIYRSQPGVVVYKINAALSSKPNVWQFFMYNNQGTSNFIVEILENDFNDSIPGNSSYISYSDFLTEGTFDLSAYRWNPSTKSPINVKITLESKDSASADLHVEYL